MNIQKSVLMFSNLKIMLTVWTILFVLIEIRNNLMIDIFAVYNFEFLSNRQ